MADSRMSFTVTGRDELSPALDRAGDSADRLSRRLSAAARDGGTAVEQLRSSLMSLAPAAIPVAASLAPIAAGTAAVAAGAIAYTAALGPQIAALGEVSEAEKKYQDAVAESGARSQEAVKAQAAYARQASKLPQPTREAAAALSVFKEEYKEWSAASAADTMTPITKSFAVFGAVLPKLTPMARSFGRELDRTITLAGGAVSTPGFDRFMDKVSAFTDRSLQRANDGLVSFLRRADTGEVGGGLRRFMDYARQQGPLVGDTLGHIGQALGNLLEAGSEVGVGMLQAVNVLASIVSAVPPEAIATLLQLAIAIKAVRLAAIGLAAARAAVVGFGASVMAMHTAAAGATGRMAALGASFGALSRSARLAVAGTGIGLLLITLSELMSIGRQAPADMDKMTSSVAQFGRTGKLGGEAARMLGSDLGELEKSLRTLSRPSNYEASVQWLGQLIGMDSTPFKIAKEQVGALDEALAQLVRNGNPQLAEAAFKQAAAGLGELGKTELRGQLSAYKQALADVAFEARLVAESQGLFGQQAAAVKAKLDAQKLSTDGLRDSLHALNNANLMARGGMRGMEAAIDAAAAAVQANGRTLDINTEKGRANSQALDDLASATMKAAESARENGASWETVNGIHQRGHTQLIKTAQLMGLDEQAARKLAAQILATPNKTAMLRGDLTDLKAKLADAKGRLKTVPDSNKARVRAEISDLETKIRIAQAKLASVDGKTATTYINTVYSSANRTKIVNGVATRAQGGIVRRAPGGPVRGPGTSTSDSIPALLSNGEYVIRAASVRRYGERFMDALNEGRLGAGLGGGMSGAGAAAGAGLAAGLRGSAGQVDLAARVMAAAVSSGVRAELEIASPSKKMQAIAKDIGAGLITGLTGTRAQISATAKDLAKDIAAAFRGQRTTLDDRLIASVNRTNAKLQGLAAQRDAITAKIKQAGEFATGLITSARQSAGLSNLGMSDEDVTLGGITSGLGQKLARIQQFTRYIQILAKRGLNKGLLQQILNMGPESGYAYASALAGAGTSALRQVNSLQGQLDDATQAMGRAGADAMYDTGKQAGRGYLDGLMSQRAAIEKAMLDLAKSMQRAIKKALGIKSPSRVMAELGRYSTQGLAVGMAEGLPALDRTAAAVASRMAPRLGRVSPGRVATVAAAQPVRVSIDIHGALDPVAVGREVQKVLLNLKRTQGVNVTLGVG
ncbi:hypothetical protein [Streptomyces sp. NPDC051310]|uniref:hypothetical protein n=1 Tax=Streptomyces sp. NPDC051310 TaxID=3365649 RepID=UPI0037B20171